MSSYIEPSNLTQQRTLGSGRDRSAVLHLILVNMVKMVNTQYGHYGQYGMWYMPYWSFLHYYILS